MRIQADREFEQNEIRKLNKIYEIHNFSSKFCSSKAFAAKQKIREFKKLLFKTKALDKKLIKKSISLTSWFKKLPIIETASNY